MSLNASTCSSSYSISAGFSRATTRQKTHSVTGPLDGDDVGTDPHHRHRVAAALVENDAGLDLLAVLVLQLDGLKRDDRPGEEIAANPRRQARDAGDDDRWGRRDAAPRERDDG